MIKRILFYIVATIFFCNIAYSQTPSTINTISVGIKLVDEVDTTKMSEMCRYYNLTEAQSEDGFHVFMANDGTKVRFKMISDSPIVEVITKQKPRQVRSYLQRMGFNKPEKSSKDMVDATRQITISEHPTTLVIKRRSYGRRINIGKW